MRVLISIGYLQLLLPDDTSVSTVMKTLSKAIHVIDKRYGEKPHFELDENSRDREMKMEYVRDNVPIISKTPAAEKSVKASKVIEIGTGSRVLRLSAGGG